MGIGIYKQGQGYWTRLMSAIALGLLIVMGGVWFGREIMVYLPTFGIEPIYLQTIAGAMVVVIFGAIGYHMVGRKPEFVDFLIATEGEMKKVNWSSKREIMGSTYLVISMTIMIACVLFVFDRGFQWLSIQGGVLESP